MTEPDFHVDINDQSVSVRLNVSGHSPRGRFYASIFFVAFLALAMCGLLFLPGKHGNPSMWHDLSSYPVDSGWFIFPMALLLGFPPLAGLLTWRYVVSAYPSDETFRCDRSTLTISRVRWLDIQNKHWDTRSYALADIVKMRYQAIARAKGASIYGLRFIAGGRTQRVLPGLKPREADKTLKAFKAFGADVPDDPTLSRKLAEYPSRLTF
jgi:hypothetical protein